jgi:tetratricopeptide (TPR) repeat protein
MLASCVGVADVVVVEDDRAVDQVWLALQHGDLVAAAEAAASIDDAVFAERARRDVEASQLGRATALLHAMEDGSWLASRYRSSSIKAMEGIERSLEDESPGPAAWLELARRTGRPSRRRTSASRVLSDQPGGVEALAVLGESLLAAGRIPEVLELLEEDEARSARLRWLARRTHAVAGRYHQTVEGLIDDVQTGVAVPEGLELLGRLLAGIPQAEAERRLLAVLEADDRPGVRWRRARENLLAQLLERRGDLDGALALLEDAVLPTPNELTRQRRLTARTAEGGVPTSPEERVDGDDARPHSADLQGLRLAREWNLAARGSYDDAAEGDGPDLRGFLTALDEAAAPLGDVPLLSDLPWRSFGLFGDMLDTTSLREALPDALLLGGKGPGLPAELSWYDVVERERVADARAVDGAYDRCLVRTLRVPGQAAAAGARFTGAGIIDVVFLDVDEMEQDVHLDRALRWLPDRDGLPAVGRGQRRALDEPLDVAQRLTVAAVADAGDDYEARLLQALSLHETQHIADAGRFLDAGLFGKLGDILSAGVLPGNVRAELERRAQLAALQRCDDPRIPLADMVAMVPVEGRRVASEHARGYGDLLAQFVGRLDDGAWEGAVPLEELGLSRSQVLVQQLHRLDAETVRAVALSIPLD